MIRYFSNKNLELVFMRTGVFLRISKIGVVCLDVFRSIFKNLCFLGCFFCALFSLFFEIVLFFFIKGIHKFACFFVIFQKLVFFIVLFWVFYCCMFFF